MSRVLVLGGTGMLGRAVVAAARRRGWAALGLSRSQADITDGERVRWWVETFRPATIVNCAAFTAVDDCEAREDHARWVNGDAVVALTEIAAASASRLVHVSSDYVFEGSGGTPYREDDPTGPCSAYGRSKLVAEAPVADAGGLVVRTSWLFGPGGQNFVTTMIGLMQAGRVPLRVVDDQIGRPTYTPFLAGAICDLIAADARGLVHYANRDPVSWHAFAREIAGLWNGGVEVQPVATAAFPRPAERPAYSVLDVSRFERVVGRRVEPWGWGLAEYLTDLRASTPT